MGVPGGQERPIALRKTTARRASVRRLGASQVRQELIRQRDLAAAA